MPFIPTAIPDVILIEPKVFGDERGYFYESFSARDFAAAGIKSVFVQDNQSASRYGVLRGLHYQHEPHAQSKLVRVLEGSVFDVAVDIRKGSPTYGKWVGYELSAENKLQLYIPKGFAHGFVVLSERAVFFYKCDNFYAPDQEGGILFDDPAIGIDWKVPTSELILSAKDKANPSLAKADNRFVYHSDAKH